MYPALYKIDSRLKFKRESLLYDRMHPSYHYSYQVQWNLRERDALGKWPMSLVERSSLSRRFGFFHPNTCLCPIYNEPFTVGVSNDTSQL